MTPIQSRDYPRLPLMLEVFVRLPDGREMSTRTLNISSAGFQVIGDPHVVACLFPVTKQPGPRERVEASAELRFDGVAADVGAECLSARCAGVFARRLAESRYRIGFQFVDLSPREQACLDALIAAGTRRSSVASGSVEDRDASPGG